MCVIPCEYVCMSVFVKFRGRRLQWTMFYIMLYETLVHWLKRNGIPQITGIRTTKNLPEDRTLAGPVITSTCQALPCSGESKVHLPAHIHLQEGRQSFDPEPNTSPSSVLGCHARLHRVWTCLSAGAEPCGSCYLLCSQRPVAPTCVHWADSGFCDNRPCPPGVSSRRVRAQPSRPAKPVPTRHQHSTSAFPKVERGKWRLSKQANKSRAFVSHSNLGTVALSCTAALSGLPWAGSGNGKSAVHWCCDAVAVIF